MKNRELASLFDRMADLLEFKGENPFKVNAYRRAARVIGDLTEDIEERSASGTLGKIPGIGAAIAKKVAEYLETGRIARFEEAREGVSDDLIALLDLPGLGPKTLRQLHDALGIENLADLQQAIESGDLEALPGFGKKKAENLLRGIQRYAQSKERMPLGKALGIATELTEALRSSAGVHRIEAAGSLRRMRETVGDIDLLATGADGPAIIGAFVRLPLVNEVLAAGDTKGSVIVADGRQVDLRVVDKDAYGAALAYFTGSQAHNIRLRGIARERGLKINEYGIWRGDERIGGENEEDIYTALDMPWIPPELREDRGEIEAAQARALPHLVERAHIRGDLHVHSTYSDGAATLEEIAAHARQLGYTYVAITDHSQSLHIANGLSEERLYRQIEEIERINRTLSGFRLLSGTEVDIKSDGTLDFPDDLLARLDLVIASVHSGFKQSEDRITGRLLSAIHHPHVDIIGHPTGRLLTTRDAYAVDLERVIEAAAETGTALEINAYAERLDLDDLHCRRAKDMGVKLAIGTDSHRLEQMDIMHLGLGVARRGWLEPSDVINTWAVGELIAWTNRSNG